MMPRPLDIPSRDDQERPTPSGRRGSGLWAIVALVVVIAAVVAATIALSDGVDQAQEPVQYDAPDVRGE